MDAGSDKPTDKRDAEDSDELDLNAFLCLVAQPSLAELEFKIGDLRGRRLGRYELQSAVGQGGMGIVYQARDQALGRDVAVKVLARIPALGRVSDRFLFEARAAATIDHPNVARIYDVGNDHGVLWFAMEYIRGESIRSRLQRGPIELARAVEIAIQIAGALKAIHDQGFLHRDLKPENVMLTDDGRVKVVDFGLARSISRTDRGANQLTKSGQFLGTPGYVSPEQATGGPLDARSDIFAFGILLCEMLSGVHPFQRETAAKTTLALMRDEPAIPAVRVQSLRETIHRALAKEPEARHQSSAELLRALHAAEKAVAGGCGVNPMEEAKRSLGTPGQTLLAALLSPSTSSAAHRAPLPLEQFLRVGTQIALALAEYHEQNGVHGRLSPANIILFATAGYAEIKSAPATWSGTTTLEYWIYLAPEQTGRFERPIDVRSDLYVLGVILYELLVGVHPFEATDALSWIHSHVAKSPRAPSVALPTIPQMVSDIVMKLLAKGPEDRYHTARGLEQDLERCRADWETAREISPFLLCERGDFDRFTIPQKVYGRDDERAALLAALTKVIDGGQPRVFLLGGGPGVGKTALVRELAKPIATANGFFCTAKFDQFQRDVPYAPIVRACHDLITIILAANDERILAWRRRLAEAVGINGGLITDLLPEAQLIIGVQPPVAPMPPLEAHRRFVDVFAQFMQVFANAEHPLVLFLDDLQWADAASLRLLRDVASQVALHSLLFIGAYRDNEVGPDHALYGVSRELEAAGTPVDTLALGALGVEPLGRIVADTLHVTPEECAPLTGLLFDKTGGNPFFFIRLLAMLHRSGLLRFDRTLGWTWDTGSIEAHDFSDNVVDLMTRQFRHCPPETAHALSLAACLGNSFDLGELAAVGEQSLEQTAVALERAIDEGLVVRTMNSCRFVHDRIQQAAYARIPDDKRAATHLSVGRILLARTKEGDLPDRVFGLLSQLNRGAGIVDDESERERLARLNLMAARRARASAAFRAAADYGAAGLQFLPADSFGRTRDLALALCLECVDCELATGNLGAAERYLASAQTHAQSRGDRAACWRGVIALHTARSQPMAALEAAFQCLRLFDLKLSLQPAPSEVQQAERAMFERLGERSIEAVAELPLMGECDIEAAMNVLAGTLPNAYFVDLHLHRLVACHMVDLTLCHGLCALSPLGVAAYGIELAISGQYEEAERFGRAALAAVDRHRFGACRAGVLQIIGASLAVWTQGVPAAIELLRASARAGLESGETVVAGISRVQALLLTFASGAPLDEVEREADRALDVSRSAGYAAVVDAVHIPKRMVQALRRRGGQDLLAGPDFDAFVERVLNHPIPLIGAWFHVHALLAFVIFGDTQRALAAAAATRQTIVLVRAQHAVADRAFYTALAMTAAWDETSADVRVERAAELRECDEQLRLWATTCPRGYFHLSALVRAEIARIEGRFDEAVATYERAILAARDCGAVHVEALAHERASAAFWTCGLEVAAELHLREARRAYMRWGALAKVEQVDRQWPDIARAYG